jgi:hypothetical protein
VGSEGFDLIVMRNNEAESRRKRRDKRLEESACNASVWEGSSDPEIADDHGFDCCCLSRVVGFWDALCICTTTHQSLSAERWRGWVHDGICIRNSLAGCDGTEPPTTTFAYIGDFGPDVLSFPIAHVFLRFTGQLDAQAARRTSQCSSLTTP